jgi:hypothetical protein
MSVEYTCDACGKKAPAARNCRGHAIKPRDWYSRIDEEKGERHACSRECAQQLGGPIGPF